MMLCEKCRTREANIRYTEVINGIKTEHNLCSQCAREMDFGHYSAMFDTDYPIGKLLSDLFGLTGEETEQEDAGLDQVVCPTCHTAYSDFVKNSRFGCPDCYGVFDLLMSENIKRIQGSVNHKESIRGSITRTNLVRRGKLPVRKTTQWKKLAGIQRMQNGKRNWRF
ncbi:MAG: hypothetical protein V8S96_08535 [Lachnospiraceae bacterium]